MSKIQPSNGFTYPNKLVKNVCSIKEISITIKLTHMIINANMFILMKIIPAFLSELMTMWFYLSSVILIVALHDKTSSSLGFTWK